MPGTSGIQDIALTTSCGVGWSAELEATAAGRQCVQLAKRQLGTKPIHLAILFATARYNQEQLLQSVAGALGPVPLIGGSDAGEIIGITPLRRAAVLLLINSDSLRFAVSAAEGLSDAPYEAGQRLSTQCLEAHRQERRRAFLMMADGLSGANQQLIRAVQSVLGTSFPIVGALTGDDLLFRRTYQYCNNRVLTDSAVGVLISGAGQIGASARHGWHPVGQPHRITRAVGAVLHELDGQPAARVYEEYLGQEELRLMQSWQFSQATVAYPLGMSIEDETELLLRNVVRVTPEGALVCTGDCWEGQTVRLMVGTREDAIEAARTAAQEARAGLAHVACGLVFDSMARRKLLGRQATDELQAIRETLGHQVPVIGCYTYGEQAPFQTVTHMGRSYFHNETALVIAVGH